MGPGGPPGCSLSGQRDVDCGTMGSQPIMKISGDSCAAAKSTEKHPCFSVHTHGYTHRPKDNLQCHSSDIA